MSDPIEDLRRRIEANDRLVVQAVNERLRLVRQLWALKRDLGIERVDPEREQALRRELAQVNTGPLSHEGLDHLVDALLTLTKRELRD